MERVRGMEKEEETFKNRRVRDIHRKQKNTAQYKALRKSMPQTISMHTSTRNFTNDGKLHKFAVSNNDAMSVPGQVNISVSPTTASMLGKYSFSAGTTQF